MSKERFDSIRNGSSQSWLHNQIHISEHKGVFALCKVNLVHAVILFEYLKRIDGRKASDESECLQRCILKIDFGPAHKKYSLSVQGKAQYIELLGEAAIAENIKKLYVGRPWFLNTDDVLTTFAKIKKKIDDGEDIPTYMVSGQLSGSSIAESKCDNCLTYAVHVLDTYKSDLNIVDWNTPLLLKALPLPNFWIRVL